MASSARHPQHGFSLIELLMVVAIMGVLASVALPLATLAHQRQQEEALRHGLRVIRTALDAYKQHVDEGRIARSADGSGYPPDLASLVNGVVDQRSPRGDKIYFLRRLPRDPFAPSDLPATATWKTRSYDSPPDKPQAGRDVYDVMSSSAGTSLEGSPYATW